MAGNGKSVKQFLCKINWVGIGICNEIIDQKINVIINFLIIVRLFYWYFKAGFSNSKVQSNCKSELSNHISRIRCYTNNFIIITLLI